MIFQGFLGFGRFFPLPMVFNWFLKVFNWWGFRRVPIFVGVLCAFLGFQTAPLAGFLGFTCVSKVREPPGPRSS